MQRVPVRIPAARLDPSQLCCCSDFNTPHAPLINGHSCGPLLFAPTGKRAGGPLFAPYVCAGPILYIKHPLHPAAGGGRPSTAPPGRGRGVGQQSMSPRPPHTLWRDPDDVCKSEAPKAVPIKERMRALSCRLCLSPHRLPFLIALTRSRASSWPGQKSLEAPITGGYGSYLWRRQGREDQSGAPPAWVSCRQRNDRSGAERTAYRGHHGRGPCG